MCGARRDCPLTALVRYARRGWPRCCGEVMILMPDAPSTVMVSGAQDAEPSQPASGL
jgi:hypothetical protein